MLFRSLHVLDPMRVLVTGSRDWTNVDVIKGALGIAEEWFTDYETHFTLVHGGCATGADAIAHDALFGSGTRGAAGVGNWAEEVHRADWLKYGRSAGVVRNREMATSGIDLCLAFWKDGSLGTKNAIEECRKEAIATWIWYE